MRVVIIFSLFLFFISCEDPITVDVPEGSTKLVVEGVILNQNTIQEIRISTTNGFLNSERTPKISGAFVRVSTQDGQLMNYHESAILGTYHSDSLFQGIEGTSYKLSMDLESGDSYESDFQELRSVPVVDDISFIDRTVDLGGFQPEISLTDGALMGEFYRWKVYKDGAEQGTLADIVLRSDRLFNGNQFDVEFEEFLFNRGDTCRIEQFSLSESAFDFFRLLQIQAGDLGESTSTSPTQVLGNIRNISNPEEEVLGFFYATSLADTSIVLQ